MENTSDNVADVAKVLAEHYQKTFELTYDLWMQRNRTFLVLLGVIGVATLLTFRTPEANSPLVGWVAIIMGATDLQQINELQNSFPFGLLQSILLIVVFYLMVNLYHRAQYVLRNYQYLGALEHEIRQHLGLQAETIAFTRESDFYWSNRSFFLGAVKWVYIALLGSLLFAFLGRRIYDDFHLGNALLAGIDLAIAIPIVVYFIAYATSSVSLDAAKNVLGNIRSKSAIAATSESSTQ